MDSSCSSCQGRRRVKTFFDANRAQLSQGKPVQAKPSRAESTGINRPALYTLTPDRPPLAACTGNGGEAPPYNYIVKYMAVAVAVAVAVSGAVAVAVAGLTN